VKTKAVIFDLGNVLVDLDTSRVLAELQKHRTAGELVPGIAITEHLLHAFERGELTTPQFHEACCRQAQLSIALESFCEIYCDMFSPIEEMIEAHAALRSRGMPTYVFSNTSELHFTHIRRRYPFMSGFAAHFLSYELGCMKPAAEAYLAVENGTGFAGRELLYIDDRLENVEAGAARGWTTIHHTHPRSTMLRLRELELV
jgi:HAD superfamily hydrolase (TIGR01509 family)